MDCRHSCRLVCCLCNSASERALIFLEIKIQRYFSSIIIIIIKWWVSGLSRGHILDSFCFCFSCVKSTRETMRNIVSLRGNQSLKALSAIGTLISSFVQGKEKRTFTVSHFADQTRSLLCPVAKVCRKSIVIMIMITILRRVYL